MLCAEENKSKKDADDFDLVAASVAKAAYWQELQNQALCLRLNQILNRWRFFLMVIFRLWPSSAGGCRTMFSASDAIAITSVL